MNRRRLRTTVAIVCTALALAACSDSGDDQSSDTPATTSLPAFTAVALGDGATVPDLPAPAGVRDGWAQQFYADALPRAATFVNLASRFATTGEALDRELPALAELQPRVAVVLFGIDDLNPDEHVTPEEFGSNFESLLDGVVASGAKTILVGTIPDEASGADTLNPLIREAVADRKLTLVDLTPLALDAPPRADGRFIPDIPSQGRIAGAFATAYRHLHR